MQDYKTEEYYIEQMKEILALMQQDKREFTDEHPATILAKALKDKMENDSLARLHPAAQVMEKVGQLILISLVLLVIALIVIGFFHIPVFH